LASAKRVLIVSQHPYPAHATLRRNVTQLLDERIDVDLVCLANPGALDERAQHRAGLRVYCMRMEHRRTRAFRYLWEYFAFFFWSLPIALALSMRRRYEAVLIDNTPDFLVFVSLVARWRGARIVFEMFELTPELMAARLRLDGKHPALRVARWIERMATRWADHLIVVSQQCKDILVERGVDAARISILPNTPPIAASLPNPLGSDATFLVTHCTLVERYGVQVAIRALALLRQDWPDLTLRVLGDGEYKPALIELARDLGLEGRVVFRNFVPWSEAMTEIRQSALGIVAIIADGYGELLLPTKLLEYVEHEVPVVCARLPTIAHHFPSDSVAYFDPGDAAGLAAQADRLLRHQPEAREQAKRAKRAMRTFSWDALAPRYMAALGFEETLAGHAV
jgi:glycosyltransferase involved in cell wall biosynthesis